MADHVLRHVRIGAVGKAHVQRGLICPAPHDHGIEPASFPGHSESFSISRPWRDYKVIQNYVFTAKKSPSRTTRNPTLAVHNLADSAGRHPNEDREPMTSNSHQIQELLKEDSSWMKGAILLSAPDPLEVVYDLDFTRAHTKRAWDYRVTGHPRSTGGGKLITQTRHRRPRNRDRPRIEAFSTLDQFTTKPSATPKSTHSTNSPSSRHSFSGGY